MNRGLQPVSDRYLDELSTRGFPDARAAHAKLLGFISR
jgi:hypothetical protein